MKPFAPDCVGRLQAAADVAIWRSHNGVDGLPRRMTSSANVPEEDYVASLILGGLPLLAASWTPLLQQWGIDLALTGVFCHQTPKARFQLGGGIVAPELADVLIVRRHVDASGDVRQCAVLVQAKMSTDGEIRLKPDDPQLHLYRKWPRFEVIGRNAPKSEFCVGQHDEQARYAGITKGKTPNIPGNIGWQGFCPWSLMPPMQGGWVGESLSGYLVKMLNFEAGREFFDPSATGCHWSDLIHYLLTTTFSLPLRTRDIRFSPDQPRGREFSSNRMAFMSRSASHVSAYVPRERMAELAENGQDFPPERADEGFGTDGMGRVIAIETWESQERGHSR